MIYIYISVLESFPTFGDCDARRFAADESYDSAGPQIRTRHSARYDVTQEDVLQLLRIGQQSFDESSRQRGEGSVRRSEKCQRPS